jgi:hypothetical protein
VFNEDTFSPTGMAVIDQTRSLAQIVARNVADPTGLHCSFHR